MSEAGVGRQSRKELAKEKARISGRARRTTPTALELAAQQWQAEQERAKQTPMQPEQESLFTSVSGAQGNTVVQSTPPAPADWAQFNPWQTPEEEKEQQKPRRLNTITIFCWAKKIMAQEWRRAKGIRKRHPRVVEMERFAKEYKARQVEREQDKHRQAVRLKKDHERILDCLNSFVDSMLDSRQRKRITSLEQVGDLLAEAFGSLGEVFDVEWAEDGGCAIWLEPWPERRARRARGDLWSALRRISLDTRLNISAYERVTDPAVWQEKQKGLLLGPLRLGEHEIRKLRTPQQARDLLAEKAGEVGRVLDITSENGRWKIRLQPWDEVRVHNLNKASKRPITEYEITVSKDFQGLSCKRLED